MKKIVLVLGILLGTLAFAGYEQDMLKKMNPVEKRLRTKADNETLSSAVDTIVELNNFWKNEMNKIYSLYSKKVSAAERKKLAVEQKNVEKKVAAIEQERIDTKAYNNGGYIEYTNLKTDVYKKRAIELAKRYDKINKSKKITIIFKFYTNKEEVSQ